MTDRDSAPRRALNRALAALLGLALATTAVSALDPGALTTAAAAAALALAGLKADVILSRYLGLAAAPSWRAAFRAGVWLLLAAVFALRLAA